MHYINKKDFMIV